MTFPRRSLPTSDNINVESVFLALGGYSTFQLWANFAILVPEIPAAMVAMLPIFVGADHSVGKLKESLNCTEYFHYGIDGNNETTHYSFGNETLCKEKDEISYFAYSTVVQEWDLHGSRAWITEMFTSIFMCGMMIGACLASQLADRYGRKPMHFILVFMIALFGCASAIVPNPYVYAVVRFMAGIGVGGYYCIYSIYLMEFLTPKWRVICGSLGLWFLGEMSLSLAAFFIPSWRLLSLVSALPALVLLLTFPFLPETPRWLLCHNKTNKAERVFEQMAKWNGKAVLSRKVIENVQKSVISQESDPSIETETKHSIVLLWKNTKLRYQLLIFIISFFSLALTYYGISFNVKNLSGDPYLNMFYMGLVDMIAFPIGAVFSNRFGRRKVTSTFLVVALTFLLILIVLETGTDLLENNGHYITLLCLMGRFGVAAAWGVYICFTAESFPTVVRSTALGICCLAANTGGVVAPQIAFVATLWPVVPHIIFFTLVLLTVSLSWLLKEMTGKPLEDF